jgi:hypothetical protein
VKGTELVDQLIAHYTHESRLLVDGVRKCFHQIRETIFLEKLAVDVELTVAAKNSDTLIRISVRKRPSSSLAGRKLRCDTSTN